MSHRRPVGLLALEIADVMTETDPERAAAACVAAHFAELTFDADPDTLDAELETLGSLAGGTFANGGIDAITVQKRVYAENGTKADAEVLASGVVALEDSRAEVLVLLRTRTSPPDEEPSQGQITPAFVLEQVDGQWLVTDFAQ